MYEHLESLVPNHSFERDFCSNFFCCGQSLPDLHLLLAHFEQSHLPAPGPSTLRSSVANGHVAALPVEHNPPLSPSSNVIFDYPNFHTPPPTPVEGLCDPMKPWFATPRPFDYLPMFDDDHPGASANQPTIVDLELDFDSKKTHLWDFFPDDDSDSSSYSSEETSVDAIRYPHGQPVTEETAFASASLPVSSGDRSISCPSHDQIHTDVLDPKSGQSIPSTTARKSARRGTRTKMYKCPRTGCLKSYLNPNGLKYHLEKGTCEFTPAGGRVSRQ